MYESFFRFTSRPFVAAPLVSNYFASDSGELARQTLTRSIDRAEGPGLIIGPAGVGKTLLCRILAARFQETFQVAMLSSTRILTRKALLQNILFELELPYRNMEEGELRLSLLDHLQPNHICPNGILLIVDEAHSLPLRLLEEIRMITNLVRDGQPRVRLVMAGGAKLEEKFASPKLESFNQRIAARCYLEPFGRDDTSNYVLSRLAAASGKASAIFDDGALRAIYQATDGIPRLINQVCDHTLVMAFAGGRQRIDAAGVEEAWADLQQLPGPWHDSTATESTGTTIEFGELETEPAVREVAGDSFDDVSESYCLESETAFGMLTEGPIAEEPVAEVDDSAVSDGAVSDGEELLDWELDRPSVTAEPQVAVCDPFGDGFDEEEVVIHQSLIQSAEIFAKRTRVVSREGRELLASMLPLAEDVITPPSISASLDEHANSAIETNAVDDEVTFEELQPAPAAAPIAVATADEPQSVGDDWISQAAFGAQMFEYTAFEPNDVADLALEALCDVNVALGDLESEYDAPDEPTVKLMDHRNDTASEDRADDPGRAAAVDDSSSIDDRAIILVESDEPADLSIAPEGSVHRVEYQTLFAQLRHS